MKKIFALLLVIATLFCCAMPAYASEEEDAKLEQIFAENPDWTGFEKMFFAVGSLGHIREDSTNPLQLSVVEDENGYRIEATYTPEYYVDYFYNNPYYTPEATDKTIINLDFRIDGGEWTSETGLWGPLSVIFTQQHTFDGFLNKETTFTVLNLGNVNEELLDGPYMDIIEVKDGRYTIDLTKHVIEMKHTVIYSHDTLLNQMVWSPVVRALKLTEENIPSTLPTPEIMRTVVSKDNNTMSFRITPTIEMQELQKLGHSCQILVKYTFQGKTYEADAITLTDDLYYTMKLEKLKWVDKEDLTETNNNSMSVQFAYHDTTTGTTSEWFECDAVVQDTPDNATVEDYFGVHEDDVPAPKCGLCKNCSRPLNICIWFLIPGCALMLTAITGVVICTIKGKRKNTDKENKHA